MKIQPVNLENNTRIKKQSNTTSQAITQQQTKDINLNHNTYNDFNLNFSGKKKKTVDDFKNEFMMKKNFSPEAQRMYALATKVAKNAHSPEVETWHFLYASLLEVKRYIKTVEKEGINPELDANFKTHLALSELIYPECNLWRNDQLREDVVKVIDKHLKQMKETFVKKDLEKHPKPMLKTPTLSSTAIDELKETYDQISKTFETNAFYDNYFIATTNNARDPRVTRQAYNLAMDLQSAAMIEKPEDKNKYHIEFYDKKADTIWKNISQGNDVVVLRDSENKNSYSYLQDSFINLINKPGNEYKNLNPETTEIIVLNDKASFEFVENLTRKIQMDKSKKGTTTVIMGDIQSLFKNCNMQAETSVIELLTNKGKVDPNRGNVRFVFSCSPEFYHLNTQDKNNLVPKMLSSYAQQSLPILSASDTKKYLTNESGLAFIKSKIKKDITADTVLKAIEITSSKEGNYPEKIISLLDTVAKYFIDEPEITEKHINNYLAETQNLSETTATEERSIILDTGKKLTDIKGMPMTLAEAQSIARQIKKGSIGTKGFVIQHVNGSAYGGGRRHTAEAIAGETQIPMVVINAKDFALKDIDALSQQASLSEAKIKKLVSNAKAQAEANRLNTAMIFIENFDNFASNPLYGISSIYEQKAFTQLMSEMESARKEGKINLVVMGSMNMPETLDENVAKPYKFLNQINVYQPCDPDQRREIIDYYIQKNNLQIAGETPEEREAILKSISETTQGFSVVDLMFLLDTAKIVSEERGKTSLDKSDFTESYLQTTTGRANTAKVSEARKRIVTSHEAGHALTLKVMYDVAKRQNKSWHLPAVVNFITLDPRGSFGGAMYFKESENEEQSFEKTMSEIVSDYGGHSCENILYDMQGSWGITQDMETASNAAYTAVLRMGMGAKTGVKHTPYGDFISESKKEMIEKDVDNITSTAKMISDMIIEEYKDFILQFTEKYYSKVATGECIIPSEDFDKMLNDWKEAQTPEKLKELDNLEIKIIDMLEKCKKGEVQ